MAYMALYRKYRPYNFNGIVGQENVTRILKNQIKSNKISHAYIFSGSRGTGKTSAAKVFARAINCLNPIDGEPCNECSVCKGIISGNITDVVEMDAASNNSVENIRQIRQEVVYATIDVKYRVYIIDEAHMLTTSAFNALLKTLEEPPENVVFILATTEQHKIPVTILSRCLRFDFSKISEIDIVNRVKFVLDEENIKYEEEAIKYIARLADGGLRDALSIADRCISEQSDVLEQSKVEEIVGAIDTKLISEMVDGILNLDAILVVNSVDKIIQKGKDLRQLAYQLTNEFLDKLIKLKDSNEISRYVGIIDKFSKLDNDLRLTARPEIVFKSCLVELCNNNISSNNTVISKDYENLVENTDIENIKKRISNIESKIATGIGNNEQNSATAITSNIVAQEPSNIRRSETKNSDSIKSSATADVRKFDKIDELKKIIVESGKIKLYSALASADIYVSGNLAIVISSNSFAYNILKLQESIESIKSIFYENFELDLSVRAELNDKNEDNVCKVEKLFNENNVDYVNID